MTESVPTPAIKHALDLLESPPSAPDVGAGYLDLLGGETPRPTGLGQRLMLTRAVPAVYERWWRPSLGRLAKGLFGPSMAEEYRLVGELLELRGGETVLDVACGPGNFTRHLGRSVGETGYALGIDASTSMLAKAAADPAPDNVAYIRGDAVDLPFREASVDAVACFAALHLFADPLRAVDQMARVLAPGGRIAVLASYRAGGPLRGPVELLVGSATGMAMFRKDEIAGALVARGFADVRQRLAGLTQFVAARGT